MRRIMVTAEIEQLAQAYAREVVVLNKDVSLNALKTLLKKKRLTAYAKYVDDIIRNYKKLLTCIPDKTSPLIPFFPPGLDFSRHIQVTTKTKTGIKLKKRKFYELLTEAMGYNEIRNKIYPTYVKKLGIKTCVYCNAQYGVTVKKVDGTFTSSFEIDHFLPKDQYPCFSVSFFNFQPSCSHCNSLKGHRDALFNLYTRDYRELEPFSFSLDRKSFLKYLLSLDDDVLSIRLQCPSDPALLANHLKMFRINEKYSNHNDEVAKLIIKHRFYNDTYLTQLRLNFNKMFSRAPCNFDEIFLGFPVKSNEVHKKPLTLLLQNISRNLGILSR